jgi:CDP-4-dehydro-6-deoxyglucose reductase
MGVAVLKARLVESRVIAPDVKHFVFDVPEVEQLPYLAGQFVSFAAEIADKKVTRAYSTASAPCGNRFEPCLNRVHDGIFSPYLFMLEPGDTVDMKGPLGYFTWRYPVRDSILVATGTGIAPFRAMLQAYLGAGGDRAITLVYGCRYAETLLYREEFERYAAQHANFDFRPTLTRPGPGWTGHIGRVQAHIPEAIGDRRDMDVYICGMKVMVDDVRNRLKDMGLDRRQIIVEKYD